jgi:hypothetical protein
MLVFGQTAIPELVPQAEASKTTTSLYHSGPFATVISTLILVIQTLILVIPTLILVILTLILVILTLIL